MSERQQDAARENDIEELLPAQQASLLTNDPAEPGGGEHAGQSGWTSASKTQQREGDTYGGESGSASQVGFSGQQQSDSGDWNRADRSPGGEDR